MTRNQLQSALKELGFKRMCEDGKTLVAYNCIQYYLYANKTPIKSIESVYVSEDGTLHAVIWGYDDEIGYTIDDENL